MGNLIKKMKEFMEGKKGLILVLGFFIALLLIGIVPLVLIFALRMMGVPAEYTLSAWVGSFILLSLVNTGGSSDT